MLCNNNEITACVADLLNSFEKCTRLHFAFFKVVQQQTISKVGNSICVCGQIISVSNSERIITRSSAVAERPRDASCLSVVSFNIPTAQFFYY